MNLDDALRRLPRRQRTFSVLVVAISALFLAGLMLPFAIGEEPAGPGSNDIDLATEGDLGGVEGRPDGAGDEEDADPQTGEGGSGAPGSTGGGGSGTGAGGSSSGGGTGSFGSPNPGVALTASDIGVTPDSVKVAVFVADLGNVEKLGFQLSSGDNVTAFDTFAEEANKAGGINGRKLIFEYVKFDPLDQNDMRRACIEATENRKVFATMSPAGYYGAAILCVTEEHQTPYITATQHEPDEWYARSNGLMISYLTSKSRILRQMVADLHELNLLKGRTIGIVDSAYTADKLASETSLLPALQKRGYKVAHRAIIPEAADQAAAAIPVEIEQMRSKGVDTVIFAVNFLVQQVWVQQAEKRAYFPRYHVSDHGGGATDGGTAQMPESYDGTIGFTSFRTGEERAGLPEDAPSARCREAYGQLRGEAMTRDDEQYVTAVAACFMVRDFVRAARLAGPDLKRSKIPRGYETFGDFEMPLGPAGSFRPGKYDAADYVRTIRWRSSCKCWEIVSPYRRFVA